MRFDSLKLDENFDKTDNITSQKDYLICGSYADNRSKELHQKLSMENVFVFSFDESALTVTVSDNTVNLRDLFGLALRSPIPKEVFENAIIDITTLNVSELLIIVKIAEALEVPELVFCYGEAGGYKKSGQINENVLSIEGRDFELSDELPQFKPVPFATISPNRHSNSKGIIIFGFEQDRIAKLFYDHEGIAEFGFYGMFQVPPSKPGWENDSTAQHFDIIFEQQHSFEDFLFSSATDPNSTYSTIAMISKHHDRETDPLFVIPAGPKPTSLAVVAAWLDGLCQGIFFDYPKLTVNRSLNLRKIHLYVLALSKEPLDLEK